MNITFNYEVSQCKALDASAKNSANTYGDAQYLPEYNTQNWMKNLKNRIVYFAVANYAKQQPIVISTANCWSDCPVLNHSNLFLFTKQNKKGGA